MELISDALTKLLKYLKLNSEGIASISITLSEEITKKVRPPRALYPGFPLGHPVGYPGQIQRQLKILRLLLKFLEELETPASIVSCSLTSNENIRQSDQDLKIIEQFGSKF